MGEKKYVFKVEKGDLISEGSYQIKLVAENFLDNTEKTVLLGHGNHYLSYVLIPEDSVCRYICQILLLSIDASLNQFCTDKRCDGGKEEKLNSTVKIIQNGNHKYQLMLENGREILSEDNSFNKNSILPSSALRFYVGYDIIAKHYKEQSETGKSQLVLSSCNNIPVINDLSGHTICQLQKNDFYVTDDSKLGKGTTTLSIEYITVVTDSTNENYDDLSIYVSDKYGNPIADMDFINNELSHMLENSHLYHSIIYQQAFERILESPTNNQLQALAKHLTDDQLQALVDHLTNHQLQTLAQELNETKLKIIVPTLGEDQLAALVKGLNPEQLGDILPHLKADQFKVLINSIDDDQLAYLTRDLSDHHLTIVSKELWHDQLQILVHTLEEDKLKDLVNKLDHEKLVAIDQDLTTDPGRIKVIIDSLTANSEKLQAFVHSISDQQFAELLNNLDAKELKNIIHKLPHEKVVSVVGDLGSKGAVIEALRKKLDEQSAKQEEMLKILHELKGTGDESIDINEEGWQTPYFQGTDTGLIMEGYIQSEYGIMLV